MKLSHFSCIWQRKFSSFPKQGMVFGALLLLGVFLGHGLSPRIARSFSDKTPLSSNTSEAELSLDPIPSNYQGKLSLFILAGQSNMSGLGQMQPDDQFTHPQMYVFGNDYHWRLAKHPLDSVANQVDLVSAESKPPGVGPGIAFAEQLLSYDADLVIGLIPCAKGGSAISEWQRNLAEDTLYGSCLKRILAASVMGDVKGVLFFQGEADAITPELFPEVSFYPLQWGRFFNQYVRDLRQDLNQPSLPIVFAQIATTTRADLLPNWEQVKVQQETVDIPLVTMIKTDDLALQDYVHFTSESYEIVGRRFAHAYWRLVSQK